VLAEIPLPMVHTAFGLAVAAAEVLLRPEAAGLYRSAAADTGLAILTGLIRTPCVLRRLLGLATVTAVLTALNAPVPSGVPHPVGPS